MKFGVEIDHKHANKFFMKTCFMYLKLQIW